jgi:hypothetical protein
MSAENEKPVSKMTDEQRKRLADARAQIKVLQEVGGFITENDPIPAVQEAKEILGANYVFGPKEWRKYFGLVDKIPEIPWSKDILKNPEVKKPHYLFLGLDTINNKPLSIQTWATILPEHTRPNFGWRLEWYFDASFSKIPCQLRWFFMPVGGVAVQNLPKEYEIANSVERTTANILYYKQNQKYIDISDFVRTRDIFEYSFRLTDHSRPQHRSSYVLFNIHNYVMEFLQQSSGSINQDPVAASRKLP